MLSGKNFLTFRLNFDPDQSKRLYPHPHIMMADLNTVAIDHDVRSGSGLDPFLHLNTNPGPH
jgi:hypothetical protein